MKVQLPLLDLMVGQACDLRCVGCTNGMGMLEHLPMYRFADLCRDMNDAARVLHTKILVLLGGEPLLHKRLIDLLRFAKGLGIADRVRVLTNGVGLHRMSDEFWDELDDLKISVYPGVTPDENIALAESEQQRRGFSLSFYRVEQQPFRAVLTRHVRSEASAQATYDGCWYRHNTRKLEDGHFFRCCTSPAISKTLLGLPPDHDGLPLAGLTIKRLQKFLDRPTFMDSCRRCHGHSGPVIAWRENRDRTAWLEESMVS